MPFDEITGDEELDTLDPLRHLMQMRQNHAGESEAILPNQRPSVRNEILDLSFPPVKIALSIDASPGCGGVAWPAGEVLSSYIARKGISYIQNKHIVELGSGTGLVGLVAGKLGGKVWITDQAPLLDIMRRNVVMNALETNVVVAELDWGSAIPTNIPHPDIILAADCVYFEPAFPLLVETLSDLANSGTDVLFCYKKRRKADKRFFNLLRKKFTWTEILDDPDKDVYTLNSISLLRLTKKSGIDIRDDIKDKGAAASNCNWSKAPAST